jgi:hypothetical protein
MLFTVTCGLTKERLNVRLSAGRKAYWTAQPGIDHTPSG